MTGNFVSLQDEDADRRPERRELLHSGALLGGACLAAVLKADTSGPDPRQARVVPKRFEASDFIYSTCLQCNTGCEIKVKIQDGLAVKIDGNPYGPRTMDPHIAWNTCNRERHAAERNPLSEGPGGFAERL